MLSWCQQQQERVHVPAGWESSSGSLQPPPAGSEVMCWAPGWEESACCWCCGTKWRVVSVLIPTTALQFSLCLYSQARGSPHKSVAPQIVLWISRVPTHAVHFPPSPTNWSDQQKASPRCTPRAGWTLGSGAGALSPSRGSASPGPAPC